jgi:hypothetical protein
MADADYVGALVGLGSMVASALAHKKKIKQEREDTARDTKFDIAMAHAAELGAPGARSWQMAHDAKVHNQRLGREPVDYGQSLSMLGRSLPSGGSSAPEPNAENRAAIGALPLPSAQEFNLVPDSLQLPKQSSPLYPGGSSPSATGTVRGAVDAPETGLSAPDWNQIKLPDDLEELSWE